MMGFHNLAANDVEGNSVPTRAALEIDRRGTNLRTRDAARARIKRAVVQIANRCGVRCELETINVAVPDLPDKLTLRPGAVCPEFRFQVLHLPTDGGLR